MDSVATGVEERVVRLAEVVEALEAEVLVGRELLERQAPAAGASDVVSDLLFFGRPGMVLLTGLTRASMIRAAELADVAAVVIVRGKRPEDEAVELARELGMPLLVSPHSLYDCCGRLYVRGLPGPIPACRRAESEEDS
jgi:predicted transcriptional regulator